MRKINFKEFNKKRKAARIDLLQIRDDLDLKKDKGFRNRDNEKQIILYELAKRKKNKMFKKVSDRKYKVINRWFYG